ncbi:hypothetical protein Tsubulata_018835 [Turnera subulata]|uniref:Uncharacterized protein n=1 Tax=Turnera subulata TaxID=218843 RepID=A0A9Q0J7Q1_9ROSI|nr:hypothetical protein Tsubulata_018835 [Turnera subulata]
MGSSTTQVCGGEGNHDDHHPITIWEVNKERLELMHRKISDPPKLLTKAAAKSSCCIFRVPQRFMDINGKSYQPHIVSIGPYHRGDPNLKMVEEHKWRYLGTLLSRIHTRGLSLEHLLMSVGQLEAKARDSYSETIHLDTHEFVEMMVLDACFVIELFRKVGNVVQFEADDPIVTMAWIIPFFYRDLLRLQNQIPFFILECCFDLSRMPGEESGPSLSSLALGFFNNAMQRPDDIIARYDNLKGRHLLDLVRSSYIGFDLHEPLADQDENKPTPMIHSVSKLRRAGIKLREGKGDSFLVVKFSHGVIEMPAITIDETMSSFLLNCVAYEQCHMGSSMHFTTYATFLDCLINTYKDVEYLTDHNIIENYFGTDSEVARFINDLGKEVAFDIERCYLSKLFNDIDNYYHNSWHVQWASFKYTYFDTPWSFISALAALVLLLLTVAQTTYTIYVSGVLPRLIRTQPGSRTWLWWTKLIANKSLQVTPKTSQDSSWSKVSTDMSSSIPAINDQLQYHFNSTVMGSFPQPTRPINCFSNLEEPIQYEYDSPQTSYTYNTDNVAPFESRRHDQETEDGEKETMEALLGAISELHDKPPASVRSKVNLDELNVPRKPSSGSRGVKSTNSTSTRGIDEKGSLAELSQKLERFKIRTIQAGGVVVKDEEEK